MIKSIGIEVGGKKFDLTLDEARELREDIDKLNLQDDRAKHYDWKAVTALSWAMMRENAKKEESSSQEA